jgi:hypothetical protein
MAGSLPEMITGGESGKGRGFGSLPRPFSKGMNRGHKKFTWFNWFIWFLEFSVYGRVDHNGYFSITYLIYN